MVCLDVPFPAHGDFLGGRAKSTSSMSLSRSLVLSLSLSCSQGPKWKNLENHKETPGEKEETEGKGSLSLSHVLRVLSGKSLENHRETPGEKEERQRKGQNCKSG